MAFPTIPSAGASTLLTSSQATATVTHTFPSLTTLAQSAGDLMIAIIVCYQGGSANAEFSGWGGGFTEFVDQSANSTTIQSIGAAYKFATGSETGTFTVTSVATTRSAMFLMTIPLAHSVTVPEATAKANGTTSAADPAVLDPANWAAEDTLWIAVAANGEISLTGTFGGITAAPTNYSGYLDSGIIGGDVIGAIEGAVAFRQLNAASEDVGAFALDVSAAGSSALTIAVRPAAVTSPNAEAVTITATAEQPTAAIDVNAECATATAEALDATIDFTAPGTNAPAECATATVTAEAVSAEIAPNAEAVGIIAAANDIAGSIAPNAEAVAVAATSEAPAASVAPNANVAAVVSSSDSSSTTVAVNAEAVAIAAGAFDATVQTTGAVNVAAECATAAVEAGAASVEVGTSADVPVATATAEDTSAALEVLAEAVAIIAAAYDAEISIPITVVIGNVHGPLPRAPGQVVVDAEAIDGTGHGGDAMPGTTSGPTLVGIAGGIT